tara:strand:- start:1312 stop:2289 length:978 start_codon:yes stop_codon:yes gene_type:complete
MAIDLRKLLFMQQAQNEQNQNNLLSTNQAQSGLLGSLMGDPTARLLIGANILGAGVKGSDPFSAITPAVLQAAQIQKALTPKAQKPFEAKDTKTGKNVFITNTQFRNAEPGRFVPKGEDMTKVKRDQENMLFGNYTKDKSVQQFNQASTQLKKMLTSFEQGTGAGDVAGVFAFMKTLDPNSVVRESEFEVAEGTGGAKLASFEKAYQTWKKLKTGERLTDREKDNFKKAAISFYQGEQSTLDNLRSSFETIATNQKLDTTNVFVDSDIRPQKGEIFVPVDPKNPQGEKRKVIFNKAKGIQLVDYKDGEYYFRLPTGELFKTKGLK